MSWMPSTHCACRFAAGASARSSPTSRTPHSNGFAGWTASRTPRPSRCPSRKSSRPWRGNGSGGGPRLAVGCPTRLSCRSVTGFERGENEELTCDGVSLTRIAREVGTPVYVYSRAAIEERFGRFDRAFAPVPHLVCYAMKANGNLAILKALASAGAGVDVVSDGELRAA